MKNKNNNSKAKAIGNKPDDRNAGNGSETNRTAQVKSTQKSIVAGLHNRESKLRFKVL